MSALRPEGRALFGAEVRAVLETARDPVRPDVVDEHEAAAGTEDARDLAQPARRIRPVVERDRAEREVDRVVRERDRLGTRKVQLRARPSSPVVDHAFGRIDAHEARLRPALMRGAQQPSCTAAHVEYRGGLTEARGEIESVSMDAIEVQGLPLRALITLRP